jgi:hypothetical protein
MPRSYMLLLKAQNQITSLPSSYILPNFIIKLSCIKKFLNKFRINVKYIIII